MELIDENLVIDMIKNQKLSYEQASTVLKKRFPGAGGLSSRSAENFRSQRSISSRVSTEKVTEMDICQPFYSNPRCFIP